MTEITRVQLQPVAKGTLPKLWIGIVLVLLLAAGAAWAAVPKVLTLAEGVTLETLTEGTGPNPGATDYALVNYRGLLDDGTVFDQNDQAPMPVDQVVPGFSTALQNMQAGGRYRVKIPAAQGYGAQGGGPIPPNADLTFEVELIEFRTREEIMQMQQQMMQQQMMQQMMQGGAAPGGAPGGAPVGPGAPAAPPVGQ
ncbi:peptidylprolyl isomerase [Croceibacterium mercuriale]|uniref:Peptidyl-prolyl cis-trans isomerase n=1 Tax=Croceibacterium mercuriale TaxID=1572751 RepID=A0A0B2C2F1_9SPHN|nr:FKBP-type peptidyl-prolyl cis-trans isomerase [Croceibacterium mercuriale]KHL26442.1 peptidylprolyl isomerase [Croceibacterium mercuriale]